MPHLTVGDGFQVSAKGFGVSDAKLADIIYRDSESVVFEVDETRAIVLQGIGLGSFGSDKFPTTGVITEFCIWVNGDLAINITGLNIPAATFRSYLTGQGDYAGLAALLLAGADLIEGEDSGDLLYGGAGNDRILGRWGVDLLYGEAGDDILDGGQGADTLFGGKGNDTYYVDDGSDVVKEKDGEGTDAVISSVNYSLAGQYIEKLTLVGYADVGTGNGLANTITGNFWNNALDGGKGGDTLIGGAGDDTYYVDNTKDKVIEAVSEGDDRVYSSVSFTLAGQYVEALILTGTSDINATGNSLANVLVGNRGDNVLNGGAGAADMRGGVGDDTYYVDNVNDRIEELSGEGSDTVNTSVSYDVSDEYIDIINLTGTGNIDILANNLANTITGNDGNNVIDGQGGADAMKGGKGNDIYFVDHAGDKVTEAKDQGTDTVNSTVTFALTGQYIENLTLYGYGNKNGTGNTLNNTLIGNDYSNVLKGEAGADILIGGEGADTLYGGAGADVFQYRTANEAGRYNVDVIKDLEASDRIDLRMIDANTRVAGNQAFSLVDAFTGKAGEVTLSFNGQTNVTSVLMDINGDGQYDLRIDITGDHDDFTGFWL